MLEMFPFLYLRVENGVPILSLIPPGRMTMEPERRALPVPPIYIGTKGTSVWEQR